MAHSRLKTFITQNGVRVDLERATIAKDSGGGDIETYADISGKTNVPCMFWKKRRHGFGQEFGGRKDLHGEFEFGFYEDHSLRTGDRIRHGTDYYEVKAVHLYTMLGTSSDTPYIVEADRRQV